MCSCGFCYVRFGPDPLAQNGVLPNRVETYGPLWESALRSLWENPLLGIKKIARQLGVNPVTLRYQAAKLGLKFPRPGYSTASCEKYLPHPKPAWTIAPETLARYRKAWLAVRETYPEASRTFLARQASAEHRWLRKHDIAWLEANQPPARKPPTQARSRPDWSDKDVHWAQEVEATTLRLKGLAGRPRRITCTAIAREIGLPIIMRRASLEKVPQTKEALENSLETIDAFDNRRIKWAAARFQQEQIFPTKTQLLIRAGAYDRRESPLVQQAADDALCMLSCRDSSNY